ncbi:hypothetical protein BDV27DRAFT_60663 [Aspergillus caelatus]|uniref:Uncharacterized protein n=1 Tax=Aspergillus caelatus TaxID=61420 RepID=A0A5N6ZNJ1_9EURO|nr:uncharacterized protein BDV27DRAFT_60663 [Aspergillus caelatus]KAE8358948.1 hypothetical protein BDV27DRAFT_60663 [Aspergillus caelatus]
MKEMSLSRPNSTRLDRCFGRSSDLYLQGNPRRTPCRGILPSLLSLLLPLVRPVHCAGTLFGRKATPSVRWET